MMINQISVALLGKSQSCTTDILPSLWLAQTFDLVLEIAGHVIGAVIVTQLEPTRHAGRDGAEAPMHPLPDRLQRLEAIG